MPVGCLSAYCWRGRQKAGNPENVCYAQRSAADKRQEVQKMSAGFSEARQTKSRKSRKCLLGSARRGRQKAGNPENVRQVKRSAADKRQEIQKMSAGFSEARQTKGRKSRKCLPCSAWRGRQKAGNPENVRRVQRGAADKKQEIQKMSAMLSVARQTKQGFSVQCLPCTQKADCQKSRKQERRKHL